MNIMVMESALGNMSLAMAVGSEYVERGLHESTPPGKRHKMKVKWGKDDERRGIVAPRLKVYHKAGTVIVEGVDSE